MFQEVNTQKWDGLNAALPQLNIIPLTPVQDIQDDGNAQSDGREPHLPRRVRRRRAVVHLALRPAADPRLLHTSRG